MDLADYTAVLLADIATFPSPRSAAQRAGLLPASAISVPEVRHSLEKLRFIQLNVSFFDGFS